jgi:Ser/Thr protein kinase RdoA (MazF antagonist)
MTDESTPRGVLQQSGLPPSAQLTSVGGGFSGASVWRVDCDIGSFALKQYPIQFDRNHLQTTHELIAQARQAGITALPEVQRFTNMHSWIEHAGTIWDLVSWQPGQPLLSEPTTARLRAAGAILGQLHRVWASPYESSPTCTAIERRLGAIRDWAPLKYQMPESEMQKHHWATINRFIDAIESDLKRLENRGYRLQATMCDCWHGHFLFSGDELTGLIDHAAVRIDTPISDLARLLGSLFLRDSQRLALLDAYQLHRVLTVDDYELLRVLEKSGLICSLIYWYNRPLSQNAPDRIRSLMRNCWKLT